MISSQTSALPPPGAHFSPSSGGRGGPGEEIKPSPPLGGRDVRGGKEGGRAVRDAQRIIQYFPFEQAT